MMENDRDAEPPKIASLELDTPRAAAQGETSRI